MISLVPWYSCMLLFKDTGRGRTRTGTILRLTCTLPGTLSRVQYTDGRERARAVLSGSKGQSGRCLRLVELLVAVVTHVVLLHLTARDCGRYMNMYIHVGTYNTYSLRACE